MPQLLDWTDFETQTNSTLSDPDGRALADRLADGTVKISRVVRSIVAWRRTEAGRTSAQARASVPVTARQVAQRSALVWR